MNAAALAIATWILRGISLTGSSTTSKIITLLIVALIFGVLNAIIKPLFALFTAPLILLTSGSVSHCDQCLHVVAHFMAGRVVQSRLEGRRILDGRAGRHHHLDRELPAECLPARSGRLETWLRNPPVVTIRVVFVCLGNICRSPMAERVAERAAADAGLTDVEFSSAGTISEEFDDPMDRRAAAVLEERGYRFHDHMARRITAAEIESADLVVAMEDSHVRSVLKLAPDPSKVSLLTDFDPAAEPGSGVPDPYFGSDTGFYDTLAAIEAAMPGLLDRIRTLQS